MNKTANFQLTQWEKTDRIMMEDFNRDNAAIDTALKANADAVAAETAAREAADTALGKKAGLQLIQTVPFPEGGSSADKPLIGRSCWRFIRSQATAAAIPSPSQPPTQRCIRSFITALTCKPARSISLCMTRAVRSAAFFGARKSYPTPPLMKH